jgi:hypothetical protein
MARRKISRNQHEEWKQEYPVLISESVPLRKESTPS